MFVIKDASSQHSSHFVFDFFVWSVKGLTVCSSIDDSSFGYKIDQQYFLLVLKDKYYDLPSEKWILKFLDYGDFHSVVPL